jgi:hypothetical protein
VGSKLTVLAAVQLIAIGALHADSAAELFKRGIDAYKASKWDEAAALLDKSYVLEGKPETLFALAQAERLGGHCDKAIGHYKKLLEQTTELAQAKLVQNNVGLCEATLKPEPTHEPQPVGEPEPKVITKTVVREVRHVDPLTTSMFALGALGIGGAVGLAVMSSESRDDAKTARTLDDANRLQDRADRDRTFAYVAGGVGVAALGFAIYRTVTSGDA